MTWFAAHVIIGMKVANPEEDRPIGVYENVFLIEANTGDEARRKAAEIGKVEVRLDDGLTIDGKQAVRIFAGVRKIIKVSNPDPYDLDQDQKQPVSGTEVTYSKFEVDNEDELFALAQGKKTSVRYVE